MGLGHNMDSRFYLELHVYGGFFLKIKNDRVVSSMQSSSGCTNSGLFNPWSREVGWGHISDKKNYMYISKHLEKYKHSNVVQILI